MEDKIYIFSEEGKFLFERTIYGDMDWPKNTYAYFSSTKHWAYLDGARWNMSVDPIDVNPILKAALLLVL